MITKARVQELAQQVSDQVFAQCDHLKPERIVIRFVENNPRRVLKGGFRRLVPHGNWMSGRMVGGKYVRMQRKVVIHVRNSWLLDSEVSIVNMLAHEFLHAKQVLDNKLTQDESGVLNYLGTEYLVRYNVSYGRYVWTCRDQFKPLYHIPWEEAILDAQTLVTRIVLGQKEVANVA